MVYKNKKIKNRKTQGKLFKINYLLLKESRTLNALGSSLFP